MAIKQLVIFSLDDQEYGVDMTNVNSIFRLSKFKIQPLPNLPYGIEGIINLRGKVSYIFDLRKKFFRELKEYSKDSELIMLYTLEAITGCIVDEVTDIVKINEEDIQHVSTFVPDSNGYTKGIAQIDKRMVILIDPDKLLAS